MIEPRFSVITITYNAAAVLEETIRSVVNQTYKGVEYIIVDGASIDNTLSIVNSYKDRIDRVISEPDKGLYDAMNKGIEAATGDYLCFLNAGDTFKNIDTLSSIVRSINNRQAQDDEAALPDILYGETDIVDSQHRFLHARRLSAPEVLSWKSFKQGMLVCHQAFFVWRGLAEPYNLNYRFSSDFDWCIRMMKKAQTIHNTHLILIDYLIEGVTTRNHKASLKERFHIMVNYYGWVSTVLHHFWFVFRQLAYSFLSSSQRRQR